MTLAMLGVRAPTPGHLFFIASARVQATVLVALMMQNAQFKTDLAAARKEVRGVLDLPD